MNYRNEYERWLSNVQNEELLTELRFMNDEKIKEAFYCNLTFGTGGLRGILGAGTNRMNIYVVAKASQGVSRYLLDKYSAPSVVIGYDSRKKSYNFAKVAASVFAANGIRVHIWSELMPVPTVSYATRVLDASAGVMITASHNPSQYNGYKVYGADGCQITTETATEILAEIEEIDIFADVLTMDFDEAIRNGMVEYIHDSVLSDYIDEVKSQSVLFGDGADRNVAIVYSPLNGTGLVPVTRVLEEAGFTNITIVSEQAQPDGNFPTCPYPNPEIREAMELGMEYCKRKNADLLLSTDPDCDRCGIAVNDGNKYKLLTANEVGLLLLDYVCAQRQKHGRMPENPVFIKTIVTTDLAEAIAKHYGVRTINVLTGFKFIGEQIGWLKDERDYIFGFEESYGYLTGSYVRDKDAVNAAFMICEMFAFYKMQGITLLEKLDDIYQNYGYSMNTLHSYEFPGVSGMDKMKKIMNAFHEGMDVIVGEQVIKTEDFSLGLNNLPKADVIKFFTESCSVVIRPSGTEPKLKIYISIRADNTVSAKITEKLIKTEIEQIIEAAIKQ